MGAHLSERIEHNPKVAEMLDKLTQLLKNPILQQSLLAVCIGGAFVHLRDRKLLQKIADLEKRIDSATPVPSVLPYEPVHEMHEPEPFNESINSSMQEELERLTSRVIEDIDAHKERQQMTSGEQWSSITALNGHIDKLSRQVESLIDSQDAQAETVLVLEAAFNMYQDQQTTNSKRMQSLMDPQNQRGGDNAGDIASHEKLRMLGTEMISIKMNLSDWKREIMDEIYNGIQQFDHKLVDLELKLVTFDKTIRMVEHTAKQCEDESRLREVELKHQINEDIVEIRNELVQKCDMLRKAENHLRLQFDHVLTNLPSNGQSTASDVDGNLLR